MRAVNLGYIQLESTLNLAVQCENSSGVATAPDAAPTWSMYGSSATALLTGSLGAADSDSKTGFRMGNAAITAANGFASGMRVIVRVSYLISSSARTVVGVLQVT